MTKKSIIHKIREKAKPNLPLILPVPERPINLNQNAQWLSGEGAGSWFEIEADQNSKNHFRISRYSPSGKTECSSIFKTMLNFDPAIKFEVIYPSHCNEVTIAQGGKVFNFYKL